MKRKSSSLGSEPSVTEAKMSAQGGWEASVLSLREKPCTLPPPFWIEAALMKFPLPNSPFVLPLLVPCPKRHLNCSKIVPLFKARLQRRRRLNGKRRRAPTQMTGGLFWKTSALRRKLGGPPKIQFQEEDGRPLARASYLILLAYVQHRPFYGVLCGGVLLPPGGRGRHHHRLLLRLQRRRARRLRRGRRRRRPALPPPVRRRLRPRPPRSPGRVLPPPAGLAPEGGGAVRPRARGVGAGGPAGGGEGKARK